MNTKYLRQIHEVRDGSDTKKGRDSITVDVYRVLVAFDVTCPARAHAIKKLLCAGIRGKGDCVTDLLESIKSIQESIEIEYDRLSCMKFGDKPLPTGKELDESVKHVVGKAGKALLESMKDHAHSMDGDDEGISEPIKPQHVPVDYGAPPKDPRVMVGDGAGAYIYMTRELARRAGHSDVNIKPFSMAPFDEARHERQMLKDAGSPALNPLTGMPFGKGHLQEMLNSGPGGVPSVITQEDPSSSTPEPCVQCGSMTAQGIRSINGLCPGCYGAQKSHEAGRCSECGRPDGTGDYAPIGGKCVRCYHSTKPPSPVTPTHCEQKLPTD